MEESLPATCREPNMAKKNEVQIDRREKNQKGADRRANERRKQEVSVAAERRLIERREKTPRRRQIDPTTCERDYSNDEIEFMHALDAYKRANGRMFPTCSEILEVIRALGYVRLMQGAAACSAESNEVASEATSA